MAYQQPHPGQFGYPVQPAGFLPQSPPSIPTYGQAPPQLGYGFPPAAPGYPQQHPQQQHQYPYQQVQQQLPQAYPAHSPPPAQAQAPYPAQAPYAGHAPVQSQPPQQPAYQQVQPQYQVQQQPYPGQPQQQFHPGQQHQQLYQAPQQPYSGPPQPYAQPVPPPQHYQPIQHQPQASAPPQATTPTFPPGQYPLISTGSHHLSLLAPDRSHPILTVKWVTGNSSRITIHRGPATGPEIGSATFHEWSTTQVDITYGPHSNRFKKRFDSRTGLGGGLEWDPKGYLTQGSVVLAQYVETAFPKGTSTKEKTEKKGQGWVQIQKAGGVTAAQLEELFVTLVAEQDRRIRAKENGMSWAWTAASGW
ncbi:hypothetical protein QBC35DRAFT_534025 [Podospora australis]|uniref:Uncharacterized protein n=1 Tax=Podospora australis TaxID=1536484 RepID=A0AAN6WPG7_9PEZI|nr:hypothetical protein QBC35DRAFT_534025 [Podospora australis]